MPRWAVSSHLFRMITKRGASSRALDPRSWWRRELL
jgi:hypothetical protein